MSCRFAFIAKHRWRQLWRFALVVAAAMLCCVCGVAAADPQPAPRFERDVWPILAGHCTQCHGAKEPKAGLDLRTVASILRGGDSGPAIVKPDPAASLLVERIAQGEMPPEGERKLSAEELSVLRSWIAAGAPADNPAAVPPPVSPISEKDRQFWSFRPLAKPAVPTPRGAGRGRTPIDAFLLARLEAKDLTFSADADRATLIRRASLDLLGLPPSPEELDAFLADNSPDACERLVDRLLASPHFGERWGRHWLDVAGYVDTIGFDTDATNILTSEGKWRYRDYVIRSFNDDKAYDRFVIEQLAGDELFDWRHAPRFTPEMQDALVATGYLRTARDLTHEDVGVIPQNFFGIAHDTLEIVGTGLLGLTLNCARCHNHKFDPIPQEDYYRLMAVLAPAYNPQAWRPVVPTETRKDDRGLPDVSPAEQAEIERHNAALDEQLKPLREEVARKKQPHEARLAEAKLAALPEAIRADVKEAVQTPPEKRTDVQKYLAGKFAAGLKVKPDEVHAAMSDEEKAAIAALEARVTSIDAGRRKWGKIQALYDIGPTPATHLLMRGSETTPGDEVPPGFLRVLSRSDAEALASAEPPCEGASGRRTALARWLTDRDSPPSALLARVMVNRVWQQLFGRSIVPTPDNFGAQGQPPTHPELLEWLSARFVEGGWRVKPLIKEMMLSTAYRQSSREDARAGGPGAGAADPRAVDPGNELLWRMRLRRLDAEAVRDSILAASGRLNRAAGGPPVQIQARPDGMVVVAEDKLVDKADQWRRSIYLFARRAYNLTLLTVFDQPAVATNCLRRDTSAVPLQSLVMLNDAFVAEQAGHLAARIEGGSVASPDARIEALFRLALARRPTAAEVETCRGALAAQADLAAAAGVAAANHHALVQLCHALFNTSEFLYAE
ncbi:MAG: DUF1553 domain-containing protein [Planctomycetia bacterium]|nr:DUF1553 domain-containing protein [Planctomycetia bacterium]